MGLAEQLTKRLRSFDPALYCAESREGKLCVYRNSTRLEEYWIDPKLFGDFSSTKDVLLTVARPSPHYIFSLTHNWLPSGRKADWSWDKIKTQLQKADCWNRDVVADLERQEDKEKASLERESRNQAEAFASEFRPIFKEAFKDVNTSNMKKHERRRNDDLKKWKY